MSTYQVQYMNAYTNDMLTLWVDAESSHHAVAEATMVAMAGTGNVVAEAVGAWLRGGIVKDVTAILVRD